jgi:Protein kinase domain
VERDAEATLFEHPGGSTGPGGLDGPTLSPSLLPASTPAPPPRPSSPKPQRTPRPSSAPLTSSDPIGGGRFVPGQIVADRYRIVALAGRGGMGEVYRAEDLRLSQIVAIKFLPEAISRDEGALARFHSEVRIARQVSHPNVCRMFDIGETDGLTYLTMEYVDGEDLSSLLRRIGRLSPDKATEIARQVCAGLAAAHERGVIHRDLKPANLMLDGAGKIRITDFGLAAIAASVDGAEVRAGTPAYMAPEQLAGKEVTFKSDLYSLGLVLYEIVTGKRAFDAGTVPELLRLREETTPTNPSALVRDMDPLLDRVILRCLQKDPALRPASALQVAAALPGGDPLAAALAAGETPSPQMVAASGDSSGLAPRIAIACFVAILLGSLLFGYVGMKENGLEGLHAGKSPEILQHTARETLARLGYPDQPVDQAGRFSYDDDLLEYVEAHDKSQAAWNQAIARRPRLLQFWYRQSPSEMVATGFGGLASEPGVVQFDDPPRVLSGMITMKLDPEGRLTYLEAMPPQEQAADGSPQTAAPDWSPLFAAAAIDPAQLHSVVPTWTTLASTDVRAAWDGSWPGGGRSLHVEAGAWKGKPVFFSMTGPWSKPDRTASSGKSGKAKAGLWIAISTTIVFFVGGIWFALRNLSRGRGDRQGAWRLAVFVFAVAMLAWVLSTRFIPTIAMLGLFIIEASSALFLSAFLWMMYIALEPYVRRHWPQTIISWTRVTSGQLRDPRVGRDLFSGVLLGMAWILIFEIGNFFDIRAGAQPQFASVQYLSGAREALGEVLGLIVGSILGTVIFFFVLVLLRVVLRNAWLAAAGFVLIFTTPRVLTSTHPLTDAIVWALIYIIAAISVVRFGLIVLAIGNFMANVLLNLPYTLDFSNWYAVHCLFILLVFVAIGAWGCYLSLAGKTLWKDELFD